MKWEAPGGPADLNGMLAGDHIIEVDDVNVLELTHHEVITFMHIHSITLSDKASEKKTLLISKLILRWIHACTYCNYVIIASYAGLPRLNLMCASH